MIFKSGASSSKIPRYDLIPPEALRKLADRFELGVERHGERAWNARSNQAPLLDKEFVIARASHAIGHAYKLIQKIHTGDFTDEDDDAAAIAWAGVCLSEAVDAIKKQNGR